MLTSRSSRDRGSAVNKTRRQSNCLYGKYNTLTDHRLALRHRVRNFALRQLRPSRHELLNQLGPRLQRPHEDIRTVSLGLGEVLRRVSQSTGGFVVVAVFVNLNL